MALPLTQTDHLTSNPATPSWTAWYLRSLRAWAATGHSKHTRITSTQISLLATRRICTGEMPTQNYKASSRGTIHGMSSSCRHTKLSLCRHPRHASNAGQSESKCFARYNMPRQAPGATLLLPNQMDIFRQCSFISACENAELFCARLLNDLVMKYNDDYALMQRLDLKSAQSM